MNLRVIAKIWNSINYIIKVGLSLTLLNLIAFFDLGTLEVEPEAYVEVNQMFKVESESRTEWIREIVD